MKDSGNRRVATVALAAVAVLAATTAQAQYAPNGPAAQLATGQAGYAPQNTAGYGYGAYSTSSNYRQPPARSRQPQGYAQQPQGYGQQPQGYARPPQGPGYNAYGSQRGYPAVAQAPDEQLPTPDGQVEPDQSEVTVDSYPSTSTEYVEPTPATEGESYPTTNGYYGDGTYTGGSGGECSTCGTTGYNGYGYGGYDACGPESYAPYGCQDYGSAQYFGGGCGRQCFFGLYGLFMERDDSAKVNTAIEIDTTVPSYPYYPPNGEMPPVTRLDNSDDVEFDFQAGAEVRFGTTFGSPCGSNCAPHLPYAVEVAYWGLGEDENSSLRLDRDMLTPDHRMYSMIDYRGLEYTRSGMPADYAPMRNYWGSPPPIEDPAMAPDPVPVAYLTRTNFSMQNLELNFLRLPVVGGCGTCGIDCGSGCGCDPCAPSCGPAWSVTGLCGVRYVRFDDDFFNAVQYADPGAGDPGYDGFYMGDPTTELFHEINVDNHLTGFQLGANVDYMVNDCWSLFWYSNFGMFNNHINHYQRVFENGAGEIRFVNDGGDASVRSSKDDIAFMGELRVGAAYQVSSHCRLTAAWRAVGISGAALSLNQIRPFDNQEAISRIDSQGALIVHGLQIGSEFCF